MGQVPPCATATWTRPCLALFFLRCCAFIIFSLMLNFSIQSKLSVSVRLDGKKMLTRIGCSLSLSLVHSSYLRAPPSLSLFPPLQSST